MDVRAVVEGYVAAWNEPDEAKRLELLEQTWSAVGVYADPDETLAGRKAVAEGIVAFRERRPGGRIEVRSGIDEFGGRFRFAWAVLDADGTAVNEGEDFGHLGDDGRIASVTGFFGPLPER